MTSELIAVDHDGVEQGAAMRGRSSAECSRSLTKAGREQGFYNIFLSKEFQSSDSQKKHTTDLVVVGAT